MRSGTKRSLLRSSGIFLLLSFLSVSVFAQGIVQGLITNQQGESMPGVNVVLTRAGSDFKAVELTDASGLFHFTSVPAGAGYIVTTFYVGNQTKKLDSLSVKDGEKLSLSIKLKSNNDNLNEVVVVGYGKQSRKLLTSSISTLQNKDFNQGNFAGPAQLLQGKVAGLSITRSGDPNATPSVTLRGPSTLRTGAAQEPFYVIDGVPGADIRLVAPDDIATMDVLKDASATAIYGTRAANGVIMITTRKGSSDQTHLSYSSYLSTESVARKIRMMDADQLHAFLKKNNLSLDPSDEKGANTNWQDEISRTAVSQNHHLALSGGNKGTTYNAAVTYYDAKGILNGSDLKRISARAGLDQRALNDHLRVGISVATTNSEADVIPNQDIVLYNSLRFLPTVPVKTATGAYTENLQRIQYYNPVALMANSYQKNTNKITLLNANATLLLPFGFKYDISVTSQNEQANMGNYATAAYTLKQGLGGEGYRSAYENTHKILENFLTYDKKIAAHTVNVLVGYSWQEDLNGDGFQANNRNFASDALGYTNLSLGNPAAGFKTDWGTDIYQKLRLISFYGRAKYDYNNKYLLQLSLRRDGSSAFGINNRWATFPAVSAAWRIISEPFMKNSTFFTDLKLRAGYGVTGNSLGFDPLISKIRYGTTAAGQFYNNGSYLGGIGPVQNPNPDLKWEKTAMTNIGVDFSILKGKVSGSVEYYDKKTTDLIWAYPVSITQFFISTFTANVGAISNKGYEATIDASPVTTKHFSWSTSFNFAHNENKLVSLSNDKFHQDSLFQGEPGGQGETGTKVQILKAGRPVGQFFTLKYAGKDADGKSLFYTHDGKTTNAPANFKDFWYVGSAQPKALLGWSNTFTYNKFDLNIFLRSALGGKVMNATLADLNRPAEVLSYNLPAADFNEKPTDANAHKYSTRYLEDASYLRLDNVTLGYTFPQPCKGVTAIRLYVSGNNLGIITGYKGIDPEVNMGGLTPGIDNKNYYPRTRAFQVGLNVSL